MSNILEQLHARRRHEVVLRSGLKVGYHYPDAQQCIAEIGTMPAAVGNLAGKVPTEEEALEIAAQEPDAVLKGMLYVRLMVAAMLDDIDGEDVAPDDDRLAIVDALEPEERQELFLLADSRGTNSSGEA